MPNKPSIYNLTVKLVNIWYYHCLLLLTLFDSKLNQLSKNITNLYARQLVGIVREKSWRSLEHMYIVSRKKENLCIVNVCL